MYILADKPQDSQRLQVEVFDAIDRVYGTEEFSKEQAINAIIVGTDVSQSLAESQFRSLEDGDYITEV